MDTSLLELMKQSIIDGDPDKAKELSLRALGEGMNPLDAINQGFVPGLNAVGEQFEQGEMFLPDLVLAGEAMKAATAALGPEIQKAGSARPLSAIVHFPNKNKPICSLRPCAH